MDAVKEYVQGMQADAIEDLTEISWSDEETISLESAVSESLKSVESKKDDSKSEVSETPFEEFNNSPRLQHAKTTKNFGSSFHSKMSSGDNTNK